MASRLGLFSHILEFKFGMWRGGGGRISSKKVNLSYFWGNFDDSKWSMRREIFMTPVDLINSDKGNPLNAIPLYHSALPSSATWLDIQIYGSCTQEIQRAWDFSLLTCNFVRKGLQLSHLPADLSEPRSSHRRPLKLGSAARRKTNSTACWIFRVKLTPAPDVIIKYQFSRRNRKGFRFVMNRRGKIRDNYGR